MRRNSDDGPRPGDEYEIGGHTLSAMQGRGLRRELRNTILSGSLDTGSDDGLASPGSTTPADTPQHTLTGAEAGSLSSFYSSGGGGGGGGSGSSDADRRVSMPTMKNKHARLDGLFPAINEAGSSANLQSLANEPAARRRAQKPRQMPPPEPMRARVAEDPAVGPGV